MELQSSLVIEPNEIIEMFERVTGIKLHDRDMFVKKSQPNKLNIDWDYGTAHYEQEYIYILQNPIDFCRYFTNEGKEVIYKEKELIKIMKNWTGEFTYSCALSFLAFYNYVPKVDIYIITNMMIGE